MQHMRRLKMTYAIQSPGRGARGGGGDGGGGGGGTGGPNLPPPLPCIPGSHTFFLAYSL